MSIRIKCPVCGYRIKAPEGAFGRRGQCPRCKLMIRIPTEQEIAQLIVADPARPEQSSVLFDEGALRAGTDQPTQPPAL